MFWKTFFSVFLKQIVVDDKEDYCIESEIKRRKFDSVNLP